MISGARISEIIPALFLYPSVFMSYPSSFCFKFDFCSHFLMWIFLSSSLTQVYLDFEREIMLKSIHHLIIKSSC